MEGWFIKDILRYSYSHLILHPVIDSSLPDDFGNTVIYFTSACATLLSITYVGGLKFVVAALALGVVYYQGSFEITCFVFMLDIAAFFSGEGLWKELS